MFKLVPVRVTEAANEAWLAFPPKHEISVSQVGEYTRVVLTKSTNDVPALPRPAWA
ncbi:MAG: hypothetical protein JO292_03220 [Betaproteobacteria bacterium]|nr:hypothetical protein [Betaproteobacteria bacterium]